MNNVRLKLSPPWITFVNQVRAMFGNDPDIKIDYNDDDVTMKVYVEKPDKASAIARLLPVEKEIGNITLRISVIPANNVFAQIGKVSAKQLFDIAFENNPVYAYSKEITGIFTNTITYVVFKNRVVQFFNDNLNDIHGLVSTLYQDIAAEIFDETQVYGVNYNTDIEERVFGMPLGEWP